MAGDDEGDNRPMCKDVTSGTGTCEDGENHRCCLRYPHKGHKCLCDKCGETFW